MPLGKSHNLQLDSEKGGLGKKVKSERYVLLDIFFMYVYYFFKKHKFYQSLVKSMKEKQSKMGQLKKYI